MGKQKVYVVYGTDYYGNFEIDKVFNIYEQAKSRKSFLNKNFTWDYAFDFDKKMKLAKENDGNLNYFNLNFKIESKEIVY